MYSSKLDTTQALKIAAENPSKRVDVRPSMIHQPVVCTTTDKIQKILDIYRFMQLKQMCVISLSSRVLNLAHLKCTHKTKAARAVNITHMTPPLKRQMFNSRIQASHPPS